jgi:hypothetical protein
VKQNFGFVTLAIIVISIVPLIATIVRDRRSGR